MPRRILSTLSADAVSMVRAFHPMVVCFGGALVGTALLFDVLYLTAGTGLRLAAIYTVPMLAGLIACLIAAADDLGLERAVLSWTVAVAVSFGVTNIALVMMVAAMTRTGPSEWQSGAQAVLLSPISAFCVAVTAVASGNLARSLGLDLKTRRRVRKRAPVPEPVQRRRPAPTRRTAPARPAAIQPAEEISVADEFEPVAPRVVKLSEPRAVASTDRTDHADPSAGRRRRSRAVPSAPQGRPSRPRGHGGRR